MIGLKTLLFKFARAINNSTVRYWLLIGNVAGFFYYPELVTRDIDIAVLFTESKDVETLIHSMENEGFRLSSEQKCSLMAKRRTIIYLEESPFYVDLLPVVHDVEIFMDAWRNRVSEDLDGQKIFLPTFEYWLILKLYAGRESDMVVARKAIRYVENLGVSIDYELLRELAKKYSIKERLLRILR